MMVNVTERLAHARREGGTAAMDHDESLLHHLYHDHSGPLLGFALRMTNGDRQRAEDIVQETLLRAWRVRSWSEGLEKGPMSAGLRLWAAIARRPGLYHIASSAGVRALRLLGGSGWIRSLPFVGGWTKYRDFPDPAGGTFLQQYNARRARGDRR